MKPFRFIFLFTFIFCMALPAVAKVNPLTYGIPADSLRINGTAADSLTRLLENHPFLQERTVHNAIERLRPFPDKTTDFYLVLTLCLLLGLIRFIDPRYFRNVWQAFLNPAQGTRQLREKLEGAPLSNLLMNLFFTMVGGAYLYYAFVSGTPQRPAGISPSLMVTLLIAGVMAIYLAKYAMIRFSGWAFRLEEVTTHYIFNVFLINKILAVFLLPFVIILAFAGPTLLQPAVITSLVVVVALFVNRYVRSWRVFGSLFQFSKFHFFTYLCASELLPMAILMKLLVRGLLY